MMKKPMMSEKVSALKEFAMSKKKASKSKKGVGFKKPVFSEKTKKIGKAIKGLGEKMKKDKSKFKDWKKEKVGTEKKLGY